MNGAGCPITGIPGCTIIGGGPIVGAIVGGCIMTVGCCVPIGGTDGGTPYTVRGERDLERLRLRVRLLCRSGGAPGVLMTMGAGAAIGAGVGRGDLERLLGELDLLRRERERERRESGDDERLVCW